MFKITYFSFLLLLIFCTISISASREDLFTDLRERMVTTQIIARGIKDPRVIEAMRKVPRHLFVPENIRERAYDDRPLPIGEGQTISQPYIVAFMTEALNLSSGDKALEIGTGSGYQAAILAEIVKEVYTIEIRPRLGKTARERLKEMGYKNIFVEIGDGYKGWPEKAPFNAVIVTCAPERIPRPLIDQLTEGGRMIIPVGEQGGIQELVLMKKEKGMIIRKEVMKVLFVPMITEEELKAR
jgi:protein-L-isoaspartate(D-aspartate) O-methyltransferase